MTAENTNNLTLDEVEVPAAFNEAFEKLQQSKQDTPEPPKRGRPRKVKDELDTTVIDEVDTVENQRVAVDDVEKDTEIDDKASAEDSNNKESVETEEYIPENWVSAGRNAGLSDETIRDLADKKPETLKKLAGEVEPPVKQVQEVRKQESPQIQNDIFKPLDLKIDKDVVGEDVAKLLETLIKRDNDKTVVMQQLVNQNASFETVRKESTRASVQANFDTMLDGMAKELPSVGNTSAKLTPQQESARESIWNHAFKLSGGNPPSKEVWEDATAWYRGKYGTKVIEQNLLTKIRDRSKLLTKRPTHRQPVDEVDTSGLSPEEAEKARGVHNIEKIQRKYEP